MSTGSTINRTVLAITTARRGLIQQTNQPEVTTSSYVGNYDRGDGLAVDHLSISHGYAMFAGVAIVSFFIAKGSLAIRDRIYRDKDIMDATFDAGGNVSAGMIASSIVAHWTWSDGLLQSTAVTATYGISGAFFYAAGATIQMLLFSIVTVQLKLRAPGAKTFLQVIRARFSRSTHITFCVFALMTNVIVTALLILGGSAALTRMIDGFTVELAALLFTATISTYTLLGGLTADLYVSYFNTATIMILMMVFVVNVFYSSSSSAFRPVDADGSQSGPVELIYNLVNNSQGPAGNAGLSYLTILSFQGFQFVVINIIVNLGAVFVDQSYWQTAVAANPTQGVVGFLVGGLSWFAVPFVFGTTMGLAYLALSAQNGSPLLSDQQVTEGLVAPIVSSVMFGPSGEAMVAIMILMTVTATGSTEVMAVSSILVFDIYQIYLKPYRLVFDASTCILCGRERGRLATARDKCVCVSMTYCRPCKSDDEVRENWKRVIKPDYTCPVHGSYRKYNELLDRLKNWSLVMVILAIIPLTVILNALQISLGWVYLFMGILVSPAVIPISLCLFWTKLTGPAMMSGAISGMILGLTSWLIVSSVQPGGIYDFFNSTGSEISMLVGNVVSILTSGLITVVVSIFTASTQQVSPPSCDVWNKTRDIDNPLRPWAELYAEDVSGTRFAALEQRPALEDMSKRYRRAKLLAFVGSPILSFIVLVVAPVITISAGVMSAKSFSSWVTFATTYGFVATIFILVMPVVSELYQIRRHLLRRIAVESTCVAGSTLNAPSREPSSSTPQDHRKASKLAELNGHGDAKSADAFTTFDLGNETATSSIAAISEETMNEIESSVSHVT